MQEISPGAQRLIEGYLVQLRQNLTRLPTEEQEDIIAEIRTHIEDNALSSPIKELLASLPDKQLKELFRRGYLKWHYAALTEIIETSSPKWKL